MAPARDDDTDQFATVRSSAAGDTAQLPAVRPAETADETGSLGGLMPMLDDPRRRFDTVMRGYDRHQVESYVAKLEDDNRVLAATRSDSSTRVSDLAAQLASAQAEIESLRRRLTASAEVIDPQNVDSRVQEVVALAQQVARQTRTDAEVDARRVHESATAAADTLRAEAQSEADQVVAAATQRLAEADETYTRKVGEADRYAADVSLRAGEELRLAREEVRTMREQAADDVASQRSVATEEVGAARAAAAAEIAAADSASSAARTEADRASREARETADAAASMMRRTAEEDFEITLRLRRRKEEEEDRERRAAALREATTIVGDANNTADRIVREARAEVERLDHERHRAHAELGVIAGRMGAIIAQHDPDANPLALG